MDSGCLAETSTDPKENATTKVYDKVGRLSSVTADGKTITYVYFDNGTRQSVIYSDGSREDYAYYNDNLVKTLVNKKANGTEIDSYTYNYDTAHNMTSKVDGKGTTTYTFDALNRLWTVTEPSGKKTTYAFDAAGNRVTEKVEIYVSSYPQKLNDGMGYYIILQRKSDGVVIMYDAQNQFIKDTATTWKCSSSIPLGKKYELVNNQWVYKNDGYWGGNIADFI